MLATAAAAAGGSGNIGCIAAAVNRFAIDAALQQPYVQRLASPRAATAALNTSRSDEYNREAIV